MKLRNFTERLQNTAAARLTVHVCMKKTDHITPVLKMLHWLPDTDDRIIFKLLLLT